MNKLKNIPYILFSIPYLIIYTLVSFTVFVISCLILGKKTKEKQRKERMRNTDTVSFIRNAGL